LQRGEIGRSAIEFRWLRGFSPVDQGADRLRLTGSHRGHSGGLDETSSPLGNGAPVVEADGLANPHEGVASDPLAPPKLLEAGDGGEGGGGPGGGLAVPAQAFAGLIGEGEAEFGGFEGVFHGGAGRCGPLVLM
jgi:hypothetical protein